MALNVILPNLSLAFSSVTFYQVARILLTPCVALMNFVLYRATLPRNALIALIPACAGVGMVSYYDSLPAADVAVKTTSGLGVIFAFTGIFASSLYTVWIGAYHRKLQMSSMQLLFNQAPVSFLMLLYVIPFVDTFPVWTEVPVNRWVMIMIVSFDKPRFPCLISSFAFPELSQSFAVSISDFLGFTVASNDALPETWITTLTVASFGLLGQHHRLRHILPEHMHWERISRRSPLFSAAQFHKKKRTEKKIPGAMPDSVTNFWSCRSPFYQIYCKESENRLGLTRFFFVFS